MTAPKSALDAAHAYVELGRSPVPIPPRQKNPVLAGWQRLRLSEGDLSSRFDANDNIGILNGKPSAGLIDVDLDAPEAVAVAPIFLPATDLIFGRAGKPRSHWEYIADPIEPTKQFKDCDDENGCDGTMLVEFRSTGSQTVWPPSTHPSGEAIRFDMEGEPSRVTGAALQAAVARVAACALLARHWPKQGSRHHAAMATAGLLLRSGWEIEDAVQFVDTAARAAGDGEWKKRGADVRSTGKRLADDGSATGGPTLIEIVGEKVVAKLRDWLRLPAAAARRGADAESQTDLGNARRLVKRHGNDLRYVRTWAKWLYWDGTRWQRDETGEIERGAKKTVLSIHDEVSAAPDADARKALSRHALASEAANRIAAMIKLAESEAEVAIRAEQLDADSWALNVLNGTLDLRAGTLREHCRDDLITKVAPVVYDAAAQCPTFMAFLERIFAGNSDLIAFVQRAVGYSLTGDVSERIIFILHGVGANGKTTLAEVLRAVLGDYALRTPTETLLAKREGAIPNDVARLKGARFVTASESEEEKRLGEAFIKDVTGGDVISARFMRAEWFDFKPECKLWFSTNHKPVIRGTDKGIWDRIRLIPFIVRIPEAEQDKQLLEKLRAELPGILRWAVEGCLAWQRDGLGTPRAIREATDGYREEMDVLGRFIEDCCVLEPNATIKSSTLYEAYKKWCEQNGEFVLTQKAFSMRVAERGFEKKPLTTGKWWFGIRLDVPLTHLTDADGSSGMDDSSAPRKGSYEGARQDPSDPSGNGLDHDEARWQRHEGNVIDMIRASARSGGAR